MTQSYAYRFTCYHTSCWKKSFCAEYSIKKRYFLLFFCQFCEFLWFLGGVRCIRFGSKSMSCLTKIIVEYQIISCMLYVSLTCYSQVSLFLLYVFIKVGESVLFCGMFICFLLFFQCACTDVQINIAIARTVYVYQLLIENILV